MKFLYLAGILAYAVSIKIAAWFHPKAKKFVRGRKNWKRKLAEKINTNTRYLWFHCASLGEFEQGRPLMEEIRAKYPQYSIVLTFYSPSGYEVRKNYPHADIIMYLPVDTSGNARKFISMIQPEKAFFIKYEYWFFYIQELKKRKIPVYTVSAIFRKDQLFFKDNLWGNWYRQVLFNITHFFVQDENSARLLEATGLNNFTISGDTRFDRVGAIAENAAEIPVVEKFRDEKMLLIAGSTWKPDEELLASGLNKYTGLKLIVAPHEVTPGNITRLETLFESSVRLSNVHEENASAYRILIIDSIGLLSSLYRYGDIAYIGGGFGVGIHNILEAATFGLPVIFGPNYRRFKEAVDLKESGGAFPVSDRTTLDQALSSLVRNSALRIQASEVCRKYVSENIGATHIILHKVFPSA